MAKKAYIGAKVGLPDGYKQVEYIESTGTQCINTAFCPKHDTQITMVVSEWANTEKSTRLWGTSSSSSDRYELYVSSGGGYRSYYGGGVVSFDASLSYDGKVTIERKGSTITIGEHSVKNSESTFTCITPLYLLAYNSNGSVGSYASVKLYSCKIYDNDVLVRDFIPCINDSGNIGLYDAKYGKFYGNAGTGAFTAGDVVQTEVAEVAKEIKKMYIGIGGVAHKVKKGYIGVGGIARLFFLGGADIANLSIGYTGTKTDEIVTMGDGKQYRLLTLTSSGTLTLPEKVQADIWLCNGGAAGTKGSPNGGYGIGGNGGAGGNFCNVSGTLATSHTITIGAAAGASSITGFSPSWKAGSGGGSGGSSSGYGSGGAKASGDTRPFEDTYFTSYPCAGGGGGAAYVTPSSYAGGRGGSSTGAGSTGSGGGSASQGGTTGGGNGAGVSTAGSNGSYYGSGGGGGSGNSGSSTYQNGYSGYQGACFIRIPLEQ